jgi:disulfide oxidoreductase YuzD
MTTRSVKPKISEKSKEFVKSLETTDQLHRGYDDYIRSINKENENRKNQFKNQLTNDGDSLYNEIISKREEQIADRNRKIKYIISKSNKGNTLSDLEIYDDSEINEIYIRIKDKNKSFIRKLYEFIFIK